MSIFNKLFGTSTLVDVEKLESEGNINELIKAVKNKDTNIKKNAVNALIRYMQNRGFSKNVSIRDWNDAYQKWESEGKISDIISFFKLDIIVRHQNGESKPPQQIFDIIKALEAYK